MEGSYPVRHNTPALVRSATQPHHTLRRVVVEAQGQSQPLLELPLLD